jgi:alginate O-acetyltransferase complex protein AlgI
VLFNSYPFIFIFLPLVLCGYFVLGRKYQMAAASFLALASLLFYGWWNPRYVPLLLISVAVNYACGTMAGRAVARDAMRTAFFATAAGIVFNLALLGFYKYANFFVDNANALAGVHWTIAKIVLPLGISFFTFTQIAFLVDTYKGIAREYNPIHYALFVTYFPHLIAGPILHHKEIMPQFAVSSNYRPRADNFSVGLTLFFIGLFKKVGIADGISAYVAPVFDAAANHDTLTFFDAWGGALSYTFQIYFDFSGYSDMAIGLSRLFGITFPENFNSPYKATSIVGFWRRWHITLSRFLRDYLYIPLGGNRHGPMRRYLNIIVTMLLGGLWHGAGWTFIVWGGLHGLYLAVNHAWRALLHAWGLDDRRSTRIGRTSSLVLTFTCVVVGWVIFRATSLDSAVVQLRAMAGLDGVILPKRLLTIVPSEWVPLVAQLGISFGPVGRFFTWPTQFIWISLAFAGCVLLPNSQELLAAYRPVLESTKIPNGRFRLAWSPSRAWCLFVAVIALVSLLSMNRISEFIYFQF